MKKGFTLVELMAVIILIGVIGLISIPLIINTIDKQKAKSFKISVEGLVEAAKQDLESNGSKFPREYVYKVVNNKRDLYLVKDNNEYESLQVSGLIKNQATARIMYNNNGILMLYVKNKTYCAVKGRNDLDIIYGKYQEDVCLDEEGYSLNEKISSLIEE